MRRFIKVLAPVIVVIVAILAARAIIGSRPEASVRPDRATVTTVEATRLTLSDYPVVIRSQGAVRPTIENTLVSEVAGTVRTLSGHFVTGGAFAQGDVLAELDSRDYDIALTRARASLARAEAQLEEQRALAEQARLEWQQLGRRGEPSALTLREPQLAAAGAERDAAAAELERAELDLNRTRIVAPYAGRVLARSVDNGQFVSRGAVLGRIHSIASVDVRLPLGTRQQTFLRLPGVTTSGGRPSLGDAPNVDVSVQRAGRTLQWSGKLVRVEGVDEATRQLNVVARISDPWSDPESPLRVGEYVQARIAGQVLEDVFVIPRDALRESDEVLVIEDDGAVYRREVEVAWSDETLAAVTSGLADGDVLVLTPLSTVVDGTPIRAIVDGEEVLSASTEDGRDVGDALSADETDAPDAPDTPDADMPDGET